MWFTKAFRHYINNEASNTHPNPTTIFSALGPCTEHWRRAPQTLNPPLLQLRQFCRCNHVRNFNIKPLYYVTFRCVCDLSPYKIPHALLQGFISYRYQLKSKYWFRAAAIFLLYIQRNSYLNKRSILFENVFLQRNTLSGTNLAPTLEVQTAALLILWVAGN
jgi:hypothetical protein